MEQPAAQDRLIGARVGNYEVRQKLGEGGMGAVYLAEHPLIGKKVALKVLHPEFSSNEDVVGRFFNEARAVNDIQHPNIVDIIDYGVLPASGDEQSLVYFIMEFLGGEPLNDLLRREAPLDPQRAFHIAVQVADALGASHRKQIVHRDLKPDNVILIQQRRESDFAKVLDFGIAKLTGEQHASSRTRTGIVMGTPAYMSPEQCEGKGNIDHRTDVYALGILLYEMLTGRVPFQGEGYGEVLVQHLTQPPARPSTVSGALNPHVEAVCMKALEKAPDGRYPSMDEFMAALQDPVGYVDSRGGLAGFVTGVEGVAQPGTPTRRLDSSAGSQPYAAPPGYAPMTPPPGQVAPTSPPPGQVAPMTPPPGQVPQPGAQAGGRGRTAMLVAVLAAVGLAGAGAGWIALGGSGEEPVVATADAGVREPVAVADTPPDAAAEALAATPPDAAPEPVEVTIRIESSPEGAAVFVGDADEPVGKTPYDLRIERGDESVAFTLKRNGFEARTEEFVPDMARAFDLHLERKERRRRRSRRQRDRRDERKQSDRSKRKRAEDDVLQPVFE